MARVTMNNVDVLINEVRTQSMDEGAFTLAGIDVSRYKICGIKSSTHFRAGWKPISSAILTADDPGWSSNNLFVFEPLREKPVVRWPTTEGATYTPAARL
jgi:microcystin degradation protein MlrC